MRFVKGIITVALLFAAGLIVCALAEAQANPSQQEPIEKASPVQQSPIEVRSFNVTAIVKDDASVAYGHEYWVHGCVTSMMVEGRELYLRVEETNSTLWGCVTLRKGYKIEVVKHEMSDKTYYYTWRRYALLWVL